MTGNSLEPIDLLRVVYTSGRVFDGLRTSDLDTGAFLRTGSTEGISSKADLHLLNDLKALAEQAIAHAREPMGAERVIALNAMITESGPINAGHLRTDRQNIGVDTRYGRHEPPALDMDALGQLVEGSLAKGGDDPAEQALWLFVDVARAQPFEDGNKRTGLFAANSLLIGSGTGRLLTIPYDEHDPSAAGSFNDLLARYYVLGEDVGVRDLLREKGLVDMGTQRSPEAIMAERRRNHPELFTDGATDRRSPDAPGPELG